MKGLYFLLIFLLFLDLKAENADFTFGTALSPGGALFYTANTITLGYMDGEFFNSLSPDISVGNGPHNNHGFANYSFSYINLPTIALGQQMYIKISSPWGDAFITDNSWSSIVGTNPPATPPLNAALIGHSDPSLITSYNDLVTFSSGGIGGLGLHIGVVPETSTYSLFLGLISIAFAIKRKKWGGRRDSNPRPSVPQTDALTN